MRDDESYQNRLLGGEVMGREQKTMKGRAKSAGSEAMVQSINQAIIRIDNVPKDIESKVLKRVEIPKFGDILEYEYVPRRGMPIDEFESILQRDIEEFMGSELVALRKKGMRPILHLDFRTAPTKFLWISLGYRDIRKLARDKCGFEVSASSETGDVKQIVALSPHLISMLADYYFSLEIV